MNTISSIKKMELGAAIFFLLLPALICHSYSWSAPMVKSTIESKKKTLADKSNWRLTSLDGDNLITEHKYAEAESIFNRVLPKARKEAPGSLDLALCQIRYARGLYYEGKNESALALLHEAQKILSKKSDHPKAPYVIWRCATQQAAVLLSLQKYAQSEYLARIAIAYTIAFPGVTSLNGIKTSYSLLDLSLQKQNKLDEADIIASLENRL